MEPISGWWPEEDDIPQRDRDWNERILEAINKDTAFVVMASVHWMNGTKFDLEEIGARCRKWEQN